MQFLAREKRGGLAACLLGICVLGEGGVVALSEADLVIRLSRARLGVLLIAPTIVVFSAVIVYPLIAAIYLSLFSIYTPTLEGEFVSGTFVLQAALVASPRHRVRVALLALAPCD